MTCKSREEEGEEEEGKEEGERDEVRAAVR
jgi:hypothetical protein